MNYESYYDEIKDMFQHSIKTNDANLNKKVYTCLLEWYKRNYEEEIKKCFIENDYSKIISISEQIKKICNYSDYDKIQETYLCSELEELIKISNKIFDLVITSFTDNNIFTTIKYDEIEKKINSLGEKIPKIIIGRYKFILSECLLDLEYLKKQGNVNNYSIRTYNYLSSIKE